MLAFSYDPRLLLDNYYWVTVDVFNGHLWSAISEHVMEIYICNVCEGVVSLPDVAPSFIDELQESVTISLNERAEAFTFPLPEVYDPNGDATGRKAAANVRAPNTGRLFARALGDDGNKHPARSRDHPPTTVSLT